MVKAREIAEMVQDQVAAWGKSRGGKIADPEEVAVLAEAFISVCCQAKNVASAPRNLSQFHGVHTNHIDWLRSALKRAGYEVEERSS